jgi:hypothetical protein
MLEDLHQRVEDLGRTEVQVYIARMAWGEATSLETQQTRQLRDQVEAWEAQQKAAKEAEA